MNTNLDFVLYILIGACLILSAVLSGSETAITSLPREKIHQLDESKKNKRIRRAKDQIEKTIGGILVANNFVNILMASLATILFVRKFGEQKGGILATLFITILVLVVGEITPKTLATRKPLEFFSKTSILIDYLSKIFAPFTNLITGSINKYGTKNIGDMDGDNEITEADIQALTALGEMEGQILPAEREIIDSLLEFSDRPVKEIMTPRVDVLFLTLPLTIPDVRKLVEDRRMSRFPVSKTEYLDDTFGVIYVKDLFDLTVDTSSDEIETKIKDVIYLPESTSVLSALNTLRERKASFACVIDENGGIEGVVTIKDVLSEFVGDLPDEHDQRYLGINRIGPGQWNVEGKTDIDDFEEFFGLEQNEKDISTVGGLFLSQSEQLPSEGDRISIHGLELTVIEVENRRIENLTVKKIAKI
ncbi:MAG: hemolysin family protein [Actinomycetota bacterium]|nr:hemolysin family protein [Actinomycetota bacterium]